jgi:hypothetical protein
LFNPLFGDLAEQLDLQPWKAFGGHFRTDGVTISLTIRVAPTWVINGQRMRRFPVLPYTAKPYTKKAKGSKAPKITSNPAELEKYVEQHPNAVIVSGDMGASVLLLLLL